MKSHVEVRMVHRRDGVRWSAQFDLRCGMAQTRTARWLQPIQFEPAA